MHPAILPVAAVLGLGGVGLRLRAMAKAKDAKAVSQIKAPTTQVQVKPASSLPAPVPGVIVQPSQKVEDVALKLGIPPSPFPQPPGTRPPTMQEIIESMNDPIGFQKAHPDVSWDAVTVEMTQAALDQFRAQTAQAGEAAGQMAVVTTNDPPPSGDLRVLSDPGDAAPQIGGVDKNGTVLVLDSNTSAVYTRIRWDGGRHPACVGWVKKRFLRLV